MATESLAEDAREEGLFLGRCRGFWAVWLEGQVPAGAGGEDLFQARPEGMLGEEGLESFDRAELGAVAQ
eukprot:scaffold53410_cov96-Cyclotella_meneghiniana.AAC.1